jgi:hypothetical protein
MAVSSFYEAFGPDPYQEMVNTQKVVRDELQSRSGASGIMAPAEAISILNELPVKFYEGDKIVDEEGNLLLYSEKHWWADPGSLNVFGVKLVRLLTHIDTAVEDNRDPIFRRVRTKIKAMKG